MKDQYFGDINDYRKYGLLRAVASAGLSIGVCWLLTQDNAGGDGELRTYLSKPSRWRKYDPELYDLLQRLHQPDVRRSVEYAGEWELVPRATYFNEVLADNGGRRDDYFRAALHALRGRDVVFLDPDNGIEVQSTRRGQRGSSRYVYWPELRETYAKGHSLLVYQHFPRVERARFIPFLAERLGDELQAARVTGLATPHVAFFLVHQAHHDAALEKAVEAVQTRWAGQIEAWPTIRGSGLTRAGADGAP